MAYGSLRIRVFHSQKLVEQLIRVLARSPIALGSLPR